jgi:hypothetical protein
MMSLLICQDSPESFESAVMGDPDRAVAAIEHHGDFLAGEAGKTQLHELPVPFGECGKRLDHTLLLFVREGFQFGGRGCASLRACLVEPGGWAGPAGHIDDHVVRDAVNPGPDIVVAQLP